MNGVHDMGGVHGMGPVLPEANEPAFHAVWEATAFALTSAGFGLGLWNVDAWRHQHERIPAADYLSWTYYEKWTSSLIELLATAGKITADEAAALRMTSRPSPSPVQSATLVDRALGHADEAERFAVGDSVRARNIHPKGHTRLPRYVRGRRGLITCLHGPDIFPDAFAHDLGDPRRPVYQVRFEAAELWGPDAGGRGGVYVDLWEDYLEPA